MATRHHRIGLLLAEWIGVVGGLCMVGEGAYRMEKGFDQWKKAAATGQLAEEAETDAKLQDWGFVETLAGVLIATIPGLMLVGKKSSSHRI